MSTVHYTIRPEPGTEHGTIVPQTSTWIPKPGTLEMNKTRPAHSLSLSLSLALTHSFSLFHSFQVEQYSDMQQYVGVFWVPQYHDMGYSGILNLNPES